VTTPYLQHEHWARLALGIGVAAFALGELSQAIKVRRGASRTDLVGELVFRLLFFVGVLVLPLARAVVPGADFGGAGVFVLGLVAGWLGLLLRWWSFATLGRYFTIVVRTSADQAVISRGPYRVLRHPSYTGLLGALLGCGLMLGNWMGAAASFLVVLLALVFRLLREERALIDALGDAYLDFAADRARLIPYLW
jgi:protein-S-isoprenylcysteine O-methyltransferase Ste14